MDSAALPALTPILDGIDRWAELAPLLPVIISLELVLSADNAVALAAITKNLPNPDVQRRALDIGISIALILRVFLILTAQIVLKLWAVQLLAGVYLLSLFYNKIRTVNTNPSEIVDRKDSSNNASFLRIVVLLAFTDLAFSIDSVAAAVAISDQFLLVITGALIGVLALRFTSGLFLHWLEIFPRLEMAGYIAVALVGIKLLISLAIPYFFVPEWFVLLMVFILFIWGFSTKHQSTYKEYDS